MLYSESGKPPKLCLCDTINSLVKHHGNSEVPAQRHRRQDKHQYIPACCWLVHLEWKWTIHLSCAKTQLKLAYSLQMAKLFLSMASSKKVKSSLFKPHWRFCLGSGRYKWSLKHFHIQRSVSECYIIRNIGYFSSYFCLRNSFTLRTSNFSHLICEFERAEPFSSK